MPSGFYHDPSQLQVDSEELTQVVVVEIECDFEQQLIR
jgi:hypothetical protein